MLDSSVFERSQPKKPMPLILDKTTDKIKNMCTECIMSALADIKSDPFPLMRERDPAHVVFSECVKFTGYVPKTLLKSNETNLLNLLNSMNNQNYYELLECAHHTLINKYNYEPINKDLNTIFKRNNIGIRINNNSFYFIKEERVYNEFIEPCLTLLYCEGFHKSNNLLTEAFDKLHEGDFKNAVLKSSLALESTLNHILSLMRIPEPEKKNNFAKRINLLRENGMELYLDEPTENFIQSIFSPIKARNNSSDVTHSGSNNEPVDENRAMYVLSSAVSSILYLVRSYIMFKEKCD